MTIKIIADVRFGARPASDSPLANYYRSPDKQTIQWVELDSFRSNCPPQRIAFSGAMTWCKFVPTDKMIGEWRVFHCEDYDNAQHREHVVRIADKRETEDREWHHRALVLEKDWQRLLAKVEQVKNPKPVVGKPNAREKFFNPTRLQVAHLIGHKYGYTTAHIYVIISRDMLTGQPHDVLGKNSAWVPINTVASDAGRIVGSEQYTSKAQAIADAKRLGAELQMAFDERVDVVEWSDVLYGPAQTCMACGTLTTTRGYEPVICDECQTALELGKVERVKRVVVAVPLENVLNHYGLPAYLGAHMTERTDDAGIRLLAEILALAGVTYPGDEKALWDEEPQFELLPRSATRGYNPNKMTRVRLSQAQYEHLAGALDLVDMLIGAAAQHSHEQGRSLLMSLAAGDITANAFDEETEARAKKMQRGNGDK